MYLRFTTTIIDEDSGKPEGGFAAAHRLRDSGTLDSAEDARLRELLVWFNKNLPPPPDNFDARRAVFWFKSTSLECISRIWEMVHLLEAHGFHITVYKCRRLANCCYWDKFQVAAYPSDHDGRITIQ